MKTLPMTRRKALQTLGFGALASLPAAAALSCRKEIPEQPHIEGHHTVAVVPCPDYDPGRLYEAVRTGWASTQPPDVRGKRIVIKPNIADFSPKKPIHTDVGIIEALIKHLRTLGAGDIILAEGTPQNRDAEWLFLQTGYESLSRRLGVPLIDLNYDTIRRVNNVNPRANLLRVLHLPETVLSADILISAAKMKTHKLAGITLSLKNMFGIIPGIYYGWPKNTLHWNGIPRSICEINSTIRTHYAVVDGIVGMEGYGPILGTPRAAGVVVMGANPLSVDATCAGIMGVDPARVDYLAMAQSIGLGSIRSAEIHQSCEFPRRFRTNFHLPPGFSSLRADRG